jgi:DNA-binding transcriptional ArsR family regulator
VRVLAAWDEAYFSGLDPRILEALDADAREKAALIPQMSSQEIVETATNGLLIEGGPALELVRLTPQYHCRPMNLVDMYGTSEMTLFYPVETPEAMSGGIPQRLLRMGDAISDANRLKILGYLKPGPRTFTEIVGLTGLYKSTVHYHLVILRAAGLLTVHMLGHEVQKYSLRPKAVDLLASTMKSFLEAEKE